MVGPWSARRRQCPDMGLNIHGLLSAALVVDVLALVLAGRAYYRIKH